MLLGIEISSNRQLTKGIAIMGIRSIISGTILASALFVMSCGETNPLLEDWDTPFAVPPFSEIEDVHYALAVDQGVLELRKEIDAIINNPDEPTFENTILALETSGKTLGKVASTFANITNTDTNDTLRDMETQIWPKLTRERDAIFLNGNLFKRVKAVYDRRDELNLGEQDARLLELSYRGFKRSGATLDADTKTKLKEINAEISKLTTQFGQNLLKSTKAFRIEITNEDDLAGLSEDFKAALKKGDIWVLKVDRSVYETFMTQSENRELRRRMFDGYRLRASSGEVDNGPISIKLAQLRAKRAKLLGYDSHAHYILEYNMAKTPKNTEEFLLRVWRPGLAQAKRERAEMQRMIGNKFKFEGHDWWHYSEKVRKAKYDFDENQTKPYFELEAVRFGAFDLAERLFKIEIEQVKDIPLWNPNVTAYEFSDAVTGEHLGLFMMDMHARDSKRGGAWMSSYRNTSNIGDNHIRPIITNNLNLIMPPEGEPTLMRFSEVETLYHEFGHGLHGLLTQMNYETFSGVDGPRDYTEFPAQIMEHWASQESMLAGYAKHYESGEVIPARLIKKLKAARNHNQGFRTTEYVAASLLDLAWHTLSEEEAMQITDARAFEKAILENYGLIPEIEPRYRSNYFAHIFSGGYSAGYYAYLWSEILDADGFDAFRETGDVYNPMVAARLKKWVFEAGGLRPADELYRNFRGSDPSIEPLLRGRGFDVSE